MSFFWSCHVTYRTLVSRPEIEPVLPAVKAWTPKHWTAGEVAKNCFLIDKVGRRVFDLACHILLRLVGNTDAEKALIS